MRELVRYATLAQSYSGHVTSTAGAYDAIEIALEPTKPVGSALCEAITQARSLAAANFPHDVRYRTTQGAGSLVK